MNNRIDSGKVKHYNDKRKVNHNLINNKLNSDVILSIVVGLKNRPMKGLLSIESLLRNNPDKKIEIIVVEDKSNNLLDLKKLTSRDNFSYYLIDTKSKAWSRSKVLNYGIKRSTGQYIITWDVCFLCNSTFINKVINYITRVNFNEHVASISVYQSHDPRGRGYGNLWLYESCKLKEIGGFDENFNSFGYEDRDVESRLQRKYKLKPTLHSMYVDNKLYVIHLTHPRRAGDRDSLKTNKKILDDNKAKDPVINKNWGEFELVKCSPDVGKI
jgi:hypothetical protein